MSGWSRWPDVDRPRTPLGWQWPANLLVAQGPAGWPRGRRALTEATEILAEAVAWWDVERSGFRDGDRWLRNLGTGGSALDLRLGSGLLANSNDPKWLGPEASGYVYLPGVAGNFLSVPDEAALDITGDIDIRVQLAMDTWTPSNNQYLLSKRNGATATTSAYEFLVVGSNLGLLRYQWYDSVTLSYRQFTSTAAMSFGDGSARWIRVTVDADNGAGGVTASFFTSTNGSDWTPLGVSQTSATVATMAAGTSRVEVGSYDSGAIPLSARIFRAQVLNGIDGTLVLDVDCDALTSGSATSFTATTGQTVTINRSTSGRKSVAMPARRLGGRACMLLGTDDYLEVQDAQQHGALNMFGSDSFTVLAVVRQWATIGTQIVLGKSNGVTATMLGYLIYTDTGAVISNRYGDGTTRTLTTSINATAGRLDIRTMTRNAASRRAGSSVNGTAAADVSDASRSLVNTSTLRVGGPVFADMEFRAAAVWRRPLTSREITVLANSGIWGT